MDKNKIVKLQEIKYKIQPSCNLCDYGNFKPNTDWGSCNLYKYTHLKHTGDERPLSIHKCGYCSSFKINEEKLIALHGFKEFLE